ncbi:MAG TPA: PD-(D/E)XK nuclease family protein [Flavobacterium sp.]|nr:PD-(D/E)XK nuclease family protein [Flavobacterium sp.]
MELHQHKIILRSTKQILKHQKEKEILKGEKFNVFSILKMETKENATHSAFLASLLDPSGTHLKGSLFLELFLNCINNKTIDIASAKVIIEHSIGKNDYNDKIGGRIDIFICDENGNCLSIENKINAPDQKDQIERYCNHKKGNNEVYYLNLEGKEPDGNSKGDLISGTHFHIISYKNHIINWLTLCMKEAADNPILRETIKQYIILMKKLTNTIDKDEEKELLELILNNYESSIFLANNINTTIANFNDKIRQSIFKSLTDKIGENYFIELGKNTDTVYSQIWIRVKGYRGDKLIFGIQNFSVAADPFFGRGIIKGIFIMNGNYIDDYKKLGEKRSNYWCAVEKFEAYKNLEVDLQDPLFLNKLFTSEEFYNGFVEHIVSETIVYLEKHVNDVKELLNTI